MSLLSKAMNKIGFGKKSKKDLTLSDIYADPKLLFVYLKSNLLNTEQEKLNIEQIEKLRTKFHIPAHCANQYLNERELVLVVGILFYVKRVFSHEFYSELKSYFLEDIFENRSKSEKMLTHDEIEGIIQYYESEESSEACTDFFLSRVFGGLAFADELRGTKFLLSISYDSIIQTSEVMYEDHMRAKRIQQD